MSGWAMNFNTSTNQMMSGVGPTHWQNFVYILLMITQKVQQRVSSSRKPNSEVLAGGCKQRANHAAFTTLELTVLGCSSSIQDDKQPPRVSLSVQTFQNHIPPTCDSQSQRGVRPSNTLQRFRCGTVRSARSLQSSRPAHLSAYIISIPDSTSVW